MALLKIQIRQLPWVLWSGSALFIGNDCKYTYLNRIPTSSLHTYYSALIKDQRYLMGDNIEDPYQTASFEVPWSGSALFIGSDYKYTYINSIHSSSLRTYYSDLIKDQRYLIGGNIEDPDQAVSFEVPWSGSTLFFVSGYKYTYIKSVRTSSLDAYYSAIIKDQWSLMCGNIEDPDQAAS